MSSSHPIPRPPNETERLAAVIRYQLLDTPPEADFDFLAQMAAKICNTPYAFVSLVDSDRVWYKSSWGRTVLQSPRDLDYCSWAILENDGLHISDLANDERTAELPGTLAFPNYRMYCAANLTDSDGHCIGTICVLDVVARKLTQETILLLRQLATQVMALIELRAKTQELQIAYSNLEQISTTDELTGLLNRRSLMEQLQNEIDRSCRSGSEFSLVMIDLDHFKKINDSYGHLAGDAVLREIGALLSHRMRSTDFAGRYGGEELSIIMVDTKLGDAEHVAEELRLAIAQSKYGDARINATASFGIAQFQPTRKLTLNALIDAADKALFKAKGSGRNCVEVCPP